MAKNVVHHGKAISLVRWPVFHVENCFFFFYPNPSMSTNLTKTNKLRYLILGWSQRAIKAKFCCTLSVIDKGILQQQISRKMGGKTFLRVYWWNLAKKGLGHDIATSHRLYTLGKYLFPKFEIVDEPPKIIRLSCLGLGIVATQY